MHTLFIVEDSPAILEKWVNFLQGYFKVVGYTNIPEQVLGLCEQSKPNVVLCDLTLPKISGLELSIQILQRVNPKPKVFLLSGIYDEAIIETAYASGVSDVIGKNWPMTKVLKIIQSSIDSGQSQDGIVEEPLLRSQVG